MDLNFRKAARQWRSSSKARAAKLGRELTLPSIDDIESYLRNLPLRCLYCDKKLIKPQMDHKISLSRGGSAETSNLALTCKPCNQGKGPLHESEWLSLLSFLSTWEDQGAAGSLLVRLRGGFWCYRPVKKFDY